jgi:hypothetical protein
MLFLTQMASTTFSNNQIGRKPNPEEFLNVHEFKKTYDFAIDRMKNSKP